MKNFETLEVGKTYKNRSCDEVTITGTQQSDVYPFVGNNKLTYTSSGEYRDDGEDQSDLIGLIEEPQINEKITIKQKFCVGEYEFDTKEEAEKHIRTTSVFSQLAQIACDIQYDDDAGYYTLTVSEFPQFCIDHKDQIIAALQSL